MGCPLFSQCGLTLRVVWNRSVCLFQTQFLNPFLCVANWILKDFVGLWRCRRPDLALLNCFLCWKRQLRDQIWKCGTCTEAVLVPDFTSAMSEAWSRNGRWYIWVQIPDWALLLLLGVVWGLELSLVASFACLHLKYNSSFWCMFTQFIWVSESTVRNPGRPLLKQTKIPGHE